MKVFLYLFYYNLLSRFSLLYYIIILFINLYNCYFNCNYFDNIFDLKFNIHDTNSEIPDVNVDSNSNKDKIPDFDQYTVKDIDEVLADGKFKKNKTLEEKLGIPYFWVRSQSNLTYSEFLVKWKNSPAYRAKYTTNIKKTIRRIIEFHDDDKKKARADIINTLQYNTTQCKYVHGKLYGPNVPYRNIEKYLKQLKK